MAKRISVVLSQGQSQNPAKRKLEEDVITALIMEPGVDVTVIPHLYDLDANHTGTLALQGVSGDLVVISWLYERATRWTLDRFGVRGHAGPVLLKNRDEDDELDENPEDGEPNGAAEASPDHDPEKRRVLESRELPRRKIYCLDLRASDDASRFVEEIRRIARETTTQVVSLDGWIRGTPSAEATERFHTPTNTTALAEDGRLSVPEATSSGAEPSDVRAMPRRIEEQTERRWYPVIDFGRCTNCMECIDFCLFGVYGVDVKDTILVEQPDNCRKGCPACSRVCPENAIIFPQHKSPAIAGAPAAVESMKIDLSRLFGAPDAVELAARERDEQLVLAGRDAVGLSVGIPKRQSGKRDQPKDELDNLIDALDELDL